MQFEVLKQSENMLQAHFMYRVLYSDGTSFEWLMKLARVIVTDEFIKKILRKNEIYRISFPDKIYVDNKGDLTRELVEFHMPGYVYELRFLDGLNLITMIGDESNIKFFYIDPDLCNFIIDILKQIFNIEIKRGILRMGHAPFEHQKKVNEWQKNWLTLFDTILKFSNRMIDIREFNKFLQDFRSDTHFKNFPSTNLLMNLLGLQFYGSQDFSYSLDMYLSQYYQIAKSNDHMELLYNFEKQSSDVRYTYENMDEYMRPVDIKMSDFFKLFRENISQKALLNSTFDFMIQNYSNIQTSSSLHQQSHYGPLRYTLKLRKYYFTNIFQKRKYQVVLQNISAINEINSDYLVIRTPFINSLDDTNDNYLLVWQ